MEAAADVVLVHVREDVDALEAQVGFERELGGEVCTAKHAREVLTTDG